MVMSECTLCHKRLHYKIPHMCMYEGLDKWLHMQELGCYMYTFDAVCGQE